MAAPTAANRRQPRPSRSASAGTRPERGLTRASSAPSRSSSAACASAIWPWSNLSADLSAVSSARRSSASRPPPVRSSTILATPTAAAMGRSDSTRRGRRAGAGRARRWRRGAARWRGAGARAVLRRAAALRAAAPPLLVLLLQALLMLMLPLLLPPPAWPLLPLLGSCTQRALLPRAVQACPGARTRRRRPQAAAVATPQPIRHSAHTSLQKPVTGLGASCCGRCVLDCSERRRARSWGSGHGRHNITPLTKVRLRFPAAHTRPRVRRSSLTKLGVSDQLSIWRRACGCAALIVEVVC